MSKLVVPRYVDRGKHLLFTQNYIGAIKFIAFQSNLINLASINGKDGTSKSVDFYYPTNRQVTIHFTWQETSCLALF